MAVNRPLQFHPIMRHALWGGTRLHQELGKETQGAQDVAESWEVCDLPGSVSIVRSGELAGTSLRDLMIRSRKELLGQHSDSEQFPLLVKFLDATHQLSVQVHPKVPVPTTEGILQSGKAESWIIVDAKPGNRMFLGLREGVTLSKLRTAIESENIETCLHQYEAKTGDCFYIEPGVIHAIGAGILVAEIQEPSDISFRLHDWGRKDSQGKTRQLHLEEGLAAANFEIGPILPVRSCPLDFRTGSELLVESPQFVIRRHSGSAPLQLENDDCMHVLVMLQGTALQGETQLSRGETAVVPAARIDSPWMLSEDAILLDSFLPFIDRK